MTTTITNEERENTADVWEDSGMHLLPTGSGLVEETTADLWESEVRLSQSGTSPEVQTGTSPEVHLAQDASTPGLEREATDDLWESEVHLSQPGPSQPKGEQQPPSEGNAAPDLAPKECTEDLDASSRPSLMEREATQDLWGSEEAHLAQLAASGSLPGFTLSPRPEFVSVVVHKASRDTPLGLALDRNQDGVVTIGHICGRHSSETNQCVHCEAVGPSMLASSPLHVGDVVVQINNVKDCMNLDPEMLLGLLSETEGRLTLVVHTASTTALAGRVHTLVLPPSETPSMGLGVGVSDDVDDEEEECLVVTKADKELWEDAPVHVGDCILSVNDIQVSQLSPTLVRDILQQSAQLQLDTVLAESSVLDRLRQHLPKSVPIPNKTTTETVADEKTTNAASNGKPVQQATDTSTGSANGGSSVRSSTSTTRSSTSTMRSSATSDPPGEARHSRSRILMVGNLDDVESESDEDQEEPIVVGERGEQLLDRGLYPVVSPLVASPGVANALPAEDRNDQPVPLSHSSLPSAYAELVASGDTDVQAAIATDYMMQQQQNHQNGHPSGAASRRSAREDEINRMQPQYYGEENHDSLNSPGFNSQDVFDDYESSIGVAYQQRSAPRVTAPPAATSSTSSSSSDHLYNDHNPQQQRSSRENDPSTPTDGLPFSADDDLSSSDGRAMVGSSQRTQKSARANADMERGGIFDDDTPDPDGGYRRRSNNNKPWKRNPRWWIAGAVAIALILVAVIVPTTILLRDDDDETPSEPQTFSTKTELQDAVNQYLQDPSPTSRVARAYGWPIGTWDVFPVEDFSRLFLARGFGGNPLALGFNEDLSGWDVSRATDMWGMFHGATSFNGNISSWHVGKVQTFRSMFFGATSFDQDLSHWDVQAATDFSFMFYNATSFRQDLCEWGLVTNANASAFATTFVGTNCPTTGVPDMSSDPPSPFCFPCE